MLKSIYLLLSLILVLFYCSPNLSSQEKCEFRLKEIIQVSIDSSLTAFKNKNLFYSSYWGYRGYLAQLKPNFSFNSTPANYNRSLTQRYNSILDKDEYRPQQNISSNIGASISQNIPFTGGTLSISSEVNRLQNFGENSGTQFSTIPFRIGVNQQLMGFNAFKWQRKIEPLKYEKAKKEYLQSVESLSLQTVDCFFDLLTAQIQVEVEKNNIANADTFYNIGQTRYQLNSLSMADIYALRVNYLNALNNFDEAQKNFKKAQLVFNSFLRMPIDIIPKLILPEELPSFVVNYETLLREVLTNNPELLGYKQQILESNRDVEQAKKNKLLSASINLNYGLNQQNASLAKAYLNPLDQQGISLSLSMPIIDWGQKKGQYLIAKRNLELTILTVDQSENDLRGNVLLLVVNFNLQQDIVKRAYESYTLSKKGYDQTKQRFILGKVDVNSLNIAQSTQNQTIINYINALRSYWEYYYNLRNISLFDFEHNKSLSQSFDELLVNDKSFKQIIK